MIKQLTMILATVVLWQGQVKTGLTTIDNYRLVKLDDGKLVVECHFKDHIVDSTYHTGIIDYWAPEHDTWILPTIYKAILEDTYKGSIDEEYYVPQEKEDKNEKTN